MNMVVSNPANNGERQLADSFCPWLSQILSGELCTAIINSPRNLNRHLPELPEKARTIENIDFDSVLLTCIDAPLPTSPKTSCKKIGLLLFSAKHTISDQLEYFRSNDFDLILSELRHEEVLNHVPEDFDSYLEKSLRHVPPVVPDFGTRVKNPSNWCIINSSHSNEEKSFTALELTRIANSVCSIEGFSAINLSTESIHDSQVAEQIANAKGILLDPESLPPQELMIFIATAIRDDIRVILWSENPFSPFREISMGIPTLEVFASYNPAKSIRAFIKDLLNPEDLESKFRPSEVDLGNFSPHYIKQYVLGLIEQPAKPERLPSEYPELGKLSYKRKRGDDLPTKEDGDPFEHLVSKFIFQRNTSAAFLVEEGKKNLAFRFIKRTHLTKKLSDWIPSYTSFKNQVENWAEIYSEVIAPNGSRTHTPDQQLAYLLHLGIEEKWDLAKDYINSGRANQLQHGKFDKFVFALWTSRRLFRKFLKPGIIEEHLDLVQKSLEFWAADLRTQSSNPTLISFYSTYLIMSGNYELGVKAFEGSKNHFGFLKLCSLCFPLIMKNQVEDAKRFFSEISFELLMVDSHAVEWCVYYLMNAGLLKDEKLIDEKLAVFLEKYQSFEVAFEKSRSDPFFVCFYWAVFLKQVGLSDLASAYLEKTKSFECEAYPLEDEMWLYDNVEEKCVLIEPRILSELSEFLNK